MQIPIPLIDNFNANLAEIEGGVRDVIKNNVFVGIDLFYQAIQINPQSRCKLLAMFNILTNSLWQHATNIGIKQFNINLIDALFEKNELVLSKCNLWCFDVLRLVYSNPSEQVFYFYLMFITLVQYHLLNGIDNNLIRDFFDKMFKATK